MRIVRRSALVPYTADQMFTLIKDVEQYPAFLPWCNEAEVHIRGEDFIEASLGLRKGRISKRFRTRNVFVTNESLGIELVGGPFRHMSGGWHFHRLGDTGCKVELHLHFEFESRALDAILGGFFENTCNKLVDSFTRRAATLYGPGGA